MTKIKTNRNNTNKGSPFEIPGVFRGVERA